MTITESLKSTLSKYVVFNGRASRREWVIWFLANLVLFTLLSVLAMITAGDSGMSPLSALETLAMLALLLPNLAVSIRRLHDTGKSGWWLFVGLVPVVGSIILLILMLQAGQPGPNQYGQPEQDSGPNTF